MELIEIKEILRKASVEVDIQGHGKHIALFETDFERVAIELVKKLTTPDVSHSAIDHLKKIVRIYEMGKAGTSAIFAQGQAMDGYTQLYNYNDLAEKAKKIVEHCN